MNDEPLISLQREMIACRLCIAEGYQIEPGAIFSGHVNAEVMLIGQAPGITEVSAKRPFNAGSGQRLFQWLSRAEFSENSFRKDQYMTAVTKCYPGKNLSGKGDRVPSRRQVLHGEADPMPASYAERIHAAIPGSELVLAPGVGHWFFVDGTEIFTDSVLEFLTRIQE